MQAISPRLQHRFTEHPARPIAIAQHGAVTHEEVLLVLSHNLRGARQTLGLTQQALATKLGLKLTTYAAYEEARCEPQLATMRRIATAFGVKLDDLLSPKSAHAHG